ncbi:uncharacterized protein LOC142352038 isoform X2 [Convolutriloba macropyga]|uniref:uncharacterized protein LOC142352038 isoform X2 n=1 Tax=Convolutriloba macropyga TaxID=536237 RepID=UPI003F51C03B
MDTKLVDEDGRMFKSVSIHHHQSRKTSAPPQAAPRMGSGIGRKWGYGSRGVSMDNWIDDYRDECGASVASDGAAGSLSDCDYREEEDLSGQLGGRTLDWIEQRIKIDKRKIDTFFTDYGIDANEFIISVMLSNHVKVGGTSALSTGQRLKKDPFLKISGKASHVEKTKREILARLAPKNMGGGGGGGMGGVGGSRVTLKVDIGHSEHSFIIGKSGHSIKAVMESTECHIHFPDSNRTNTEEKSNQVSIAGSTMANVERARHTLRNMQQLELSFELPLSTVLASTAADCLASPPDDISGSGLLSAGKRNSRIVGAPDLSNPVLQKIGQKYEINISVDKSGSGTTAGRSPFNIAASPSPQMEALGAASTIVFTTKGACSNTDKVKSGTQELMDYLTQNYTAPMCVQTTVDVSPQHQAFVFGKDRFHVQRIINKTNCLVSLPDPQHSGHLPPARRGTVYIQGNINNVVAAREMLIAHLPVVFLFDAPVDLASRQDDIEAISKKFDCHVNVKYKPKLGYSSVVVKTVEKNVASCYEIRRQLGYQNEPNPAGEPVVVQNSFRMQHPSAGTDTSFPLYPPGADLSSIPLPMNPDLIPQHLRTAAAAHHNRMSWPSSSQLGSQEHLQMNKNVIASTAAAAAAVNASPGSMANSAIHNHLYQQIMLNSMLQSQQQSAFDQLLHSTAAGTLNQQQPSQLNIPPSLTSQTSPPLTNEQILLLHQINACGLYGSSSSLPDNNSQSVSPHPQIGSGPEIASGSPFIPVPSGSASNLGPGRTSGVASGHWMSSGSLDGINSHNLPFNAQIPQPMSSFDSNLSDSPPETRGVMGILDAHQIASGGANVAGLARRHNSGDNMHSLKVPIEHSGDERCSVSSDQGSFNASFNNNTNPNTTTNSGPTASSMEAMNQSLADMMMRAVSNAQHLTNKTDQNDAIIGSLGKDSSNLLTVANLNELQPPLDDSTMRTSSVSSYSSQQTLTPGKAAAAGSSVSTATAVLNESIKEPSNASQVLADSAFFNKLLLEQDRKRILAQHAIEQDVGSKPELRIPTLGWAGLGFSRSMPLASLRQLGVNGSGGSGGVVGQKQRSNGGALRHDSVFEDDERIAAPLLSPAGSESQWKDDVIHPSDPSQKGSKHGAPGDKPVLASSAAPNQPMSTSSPKSNLFSIPQQSQQPLSSVSMATTRPTSFTSQMAITPSANQEFRTTPDQTTPVSGGPRPQPYTFATSNQVDGLSKLFKRPPNAFPSMSYMQRGNGVSESQPGFSAMSGSVNRVGCSGTGETVAGVLSSSGLAKYIDLFREQEVRQGF